MLTTYAGIIVFLPDHPGNLFETLVKYAKYILRMPISPPDMLFIAVLCMRSFVFAQGI